jgi:hypothetical protein
MVSNSSSLRRKLILDRRYGFVTTRFRSHSDHIVSRSTGGILLAHNEWRSIAGPRTVARGHVRTV